MATKLDSPIIMLGFGRSGTSIIADVVLRHRDIGYLSNYHVRFPDTPSLNGLRILFENGLWRIQGQKKQLNEVSWINKYAFKSAEAYQFLNRLTGRDFRRDFLYGVTEPPEAADRIRRGFARVVRAQFRKRLGFKITGPSRLGYLASVFPDARFVWIRRQALPNIRSLLNVDFYQSRKHALWWHGADVYSQEELAFAEHNADRPELIAALQYFKVNQIHGYEADRLGLWPRILPVDYEDFVSGPEEQVNRILDFAGLKPDREVSDFLENNRIFSRNIATGYYFSREVDEEVEKLGRRGIPSGPAISASLG